MAILKHIASKNADYGEAERYLIFQHDEYTQKPILDENGHMLIREEYYLDGINCDPFTFAAECQETNAYFHKNQSYNEIKSHHYIISFDPRDGTDNGLTVDKAQSLGEEFCKEHFPGHQAIVCTHPDGHNHSGNIHVHIVINSLRIEAVPLLVLPIAEIGAHTGYGKIFIAAVQRGKAIVLTGDKPPVFIKGRLHGKLVMLKGKVLLGCPVVGIFRADMFECCQRLHLLSARLQTSRLQGRKWRLGLRRTGRCTAHRIRSDTGQSD